MEKRKIIRFFIEISFFFSTFVAANSTLSKMTPMDEPKRILFIAQQISPFLNEETPVRMLNRRLPECFQGSGYETRTFMPKFGEINERRHQLHDVIRLSGMNIIISDSDHPLLIKVASIQSARLQFYFIDNDDYFHRRKGCANEQGEYTDNDERCIFFARSVLETMRKLRWTPDVVYCSGWMSALVPLYVKKAFSDTPFFSHATVVVGLDENEFSVPFGTDFANKAMVSGVRRNDLRTIAGLPVTYEDLMRLAIEYADAVALTPDGVSGRLKNYAENQSKPIFQIEEDHLDSFITFCNQLISKE